VFYLNVEEFMVEIDEGSLKNVGAPNKAGTAKLFGVERVAAREFGDSQVKIVADDGDSEVQVALDPDQAESVADDLDRLRRESDVFE